MSKRRECPARKEIFRARQLRKNLTFPERVLWYLLRDKRLAGLKFRRQHPVGPFIVDYFSVAKKLVIELDGDSHADRGEYDIRRQQFLERQGFTVLRFSNDDVLEDLEPIAIAIATAAGIKFD